MRQEWLKSPNQQKLLMSMEEVIAFANSSKIIVQENVEYTAKCNCKAITGMICVLYQNGKVSKLDIKAAMANIMDSIITLARSYPRICDNVGDMFCAFANMQALDVVWLAECAGRHSDYACKLKIIECAMKSIQEAHGNAAVRSCFSDRSERNALEKLLGANEFAKLKALFQDDSNTTDAHQHSDSSSSSSSSSESESEDDVEQFQYRKDISSSKTTSSSSSSSSESEDSSKGEVASHSNEG